MTSRPVLLALGIVVVTQAMCPERSVAGGFHNPLDQMIQLQGFTSGATTSGHNGVDLDADQGDPVYAIGAGTVFYYSSTADGYGGGGAGGCPTVDGTVLFIRHRKSDGSYFVVQYGHIQNVPVGLRYSGRDGNGPVVTQGQKIAEIGVFAPCRTSPCAGTRCDHLHFGWWDSENNIPNNQWGYGPACFPGGCWINPLTGMSTYSPYGDCVAPPVPSVTAPTSGATCQATNVTLDWTPSAGAEGYDLQLTTTSNCTGGSVYDLPDNSSYAPAGLAAGTPYYWRVRSKDACGAVSAWSGCWSFTTAPAQPSPPALLSPANGAVVASTGSVALDWNDVSGAVSYEMQFGASCGSGSPTGYTQSAGTATGIAGGTTYLWRVRAQISCGVWSNWSSCFSFTAGSGCLASGPCPGREIPHTCLPPTTCCPASAAGSPQLPDLSMTQWGGVGCPVREQLGTGGTFSVGFEYRAQRSTGVQIALGDFRGAASAGPVLGEATLEPGDGDWRPFWSAPLRVAEEAVVRFPNLRVLTSSPGSIEVRRVRVVRTGQQ